jgi:hypothetical protein
MLRVSALGSPANAEFAFVGVAGGAAQHDIPKIRGYTNTQIRLEQMAGPLAATASTWIRPLPARQEGYWLEWTAR